MQESDWNKGGACVKGKCCQVGQMTAYWHADGSDGKKRKSGNVETGVNYYSNFLEQEKGLGSNKEWTCENFIHTF